MATDFEEIYTDVRSRCKLKSTSNTLIKGYINDRYQSLANKYPWPWLYEKTTLETVDKYTTGTVTVTEDSATVAGSGTTFTSAMVGRKFKASAFEEIYTIAAFVSATEITLDNEYNGDDDSGAGYEIFQDLISLPSNLDNIVVLRQHMTAIKLINIGIRELYRLIPSPSIEDADPTHYAYYEPDSSGNQQLVLYHPPYREIVLDLEYKKQVTELSADTDEPLIPEQYRQILKWGAMSDIYANKLKDARWQVAENKYLMMTNEMLGKIKNVDDVMRFTPENKRTNRLDLQALINSGYDIGDLFWTL